jgi:hypothetical protein
LFSRQFALLHSHRMRLTAVANLFIFAHQSLLVTQKTTPEMFGTRLVPKPWHDCA